MGFFQLSCVLSHLNHCIGSQSSVSRRLGRSQPCSKPARHREKSLEDGACATRNVAYITYLLVAQEAIVLRRCLVRHPAPLQTCTREVTRASDQAHYTSKARLCRAMHWCIVASAGKTHLKLRLRVPGLLVSFCLRLLNLCLSLQTLDRFQSLQRHWSAYTTSGHGRCNLSLKNSTGAGCAFAEAEAK